MSAAVVPGLPYSAPCSTCGAAPGQPCIAQRAPFDACSWPHRARVAAAEARGRQRELLLVGSA